MNKEFMNLPQWHEFVREYALTSAQQDQFAHYLTMVVESNELFNLTAIVKPVDVIAYHFRDSLALAGVIDVKKITTLADIGTGAGFPGIPLKIAFPHLNVVLIEVSHKKGVFLNTVIEQLALEDIEVCAFDWRTLLRKTNMAIDLFVSRASLHTDELMRMFKPSCPYRNSKLVYWASNEWQPTKSEQPFLIREQSYQIKSKLRRLIFFAVSH